MAHFANTVPHIDPDIVLETKDVLGDDFSKLVKNFNEDVQGHLTSIELSRASNDFSTIRESAHSLKSSSFQIGAMRMHYITKTIEQFLNDTHAPSTIAHETELDDLIEQLQISFAAYQKDILPYM
jgi:HPt (histidine-containing phosphotransfer) domain-containing protein